MKPSILFWFYKDAPICRNRLKLLRKYNANVRIYGLFGGKEVDAAPFEKALAPYLDDFYHFPTTDDAWWKWFNGDLVLREWFIARGRHLSWSSILVVQWDMLVFGRLSEILNGASDDSLILSGLRPVRDVESWWAWVRDDKRSSYEAFLAFMNKHYGYVDEPMCCQFVFVRFPRRFLKCYAEIEPVELGFLEYRIPTFAQVFNVPFGTVPSADSWWEGDPDAVHVPEHDRVLSARRAEVSLSAVFRHLRKRRGVGVIHPFYRPLPLDVKSAARFIRSTFRSGRIRSNIFL